MNDLVVGDRCWFLHDGFSSFVEVTDRRTHCVGEPIEFTLYSVKKIVSGHVVPVVHRSDLFKCPEERSRLVVELRHTLRRTQDYLEELGNRDPLEIPDPERDEI